MVALGRQFSKLGGRNYLHGNHILGGGNPWGCHSRSAGVVITIVLVVITVGQGGFITVVGVWWSGFAVQTQPPMLPREYIDLRVGPGSLEQV